MNFSSSIVVQNRYPSLAQSSQKAGLFGRNINQYNLGGKLHNNNNNINGNSSGNCGLNNNQNQNFLKTCQVPEILMINRYYGLVPKKFVINSRSDYLSSKFGKNKSRIRPKSSIHPSTKSSLDLADKNINSGSCTVENPQDFQGDVEIIARKISVEKPSKRWKNSRSLSALTSDILDGNQFDFEGNNLQKSQKSIDSQKQRIIKIDLNNLKWEENIVFKEPEIPEEFLKCKSDDEIETQVKTTEISVQNPMMGKSEVKKRRGLLRKTVSFDDQILLNENQDKIQGRNNIEIKGPANIIEKTEGPSTSNVQKSKIPCENPTPVQYPIISTVKPSTASQPETRSKSAKYRRPLNRSLSLDTGTGESDLESSFNPSLSVEGLKDNFSEIYISHERKNCLHVQTQPEISTMVSLISPQRTKDEEEVIQFEIEKIAEILNKKQPEVQNIVENFEKSSQETTITTIENKNQTVQEPEIESETSAIPLPRKTRPPLKKAISISCENELISMTKTQNNKPERPKTSKGRITTNDGTKKSSIVRPVTANLGQSEIKIISKTTNGSDKKPLTNSLSDSSNTKNRKIMIKKALIEINQAALLIGKKSGFLRPKTAPAQKHFGGSGTENTGKSNSRQPFKVSPSPHISSYFERNQPKSKENSTKNINVDEHDKNNNGTPSTDGLQSKLIEQQHKRAAFLARKSISLDEGLLFCTGEKSDHPENDCITSNIRNSKKRDDCLKVYEKMMKNGCQIKLDTIFRGMMTPSEYREFVRVRPEPEEKVQNEDKNVTQVSHDNDNLLTNV